MYFVEPVIRGKFDLKKLDRIDLSKIGEVKALYLDALGESEELNSAAMLRSKLSTKGKIFSTDDIRYHLNELVRLGLVNKTKKTKKTKKLDHRAQYFYSLNSRYAGFYYLYSSREWKHITQKIPKGRHDLLVILDYHVLNKKGDVVVSEFFMFENTGETPIEEERHWIFADEGFLNFKELELEAFSVDRTLEFKPIIDTERHEVDFRIYFKRPIKKDETCSYWYKRKRKSAFPVGHQHIYYDVKTSAELLIIGITLQEEIKDIKKITGTFISRDMSEKIEAPIKPFHYKENGRIKILWYVPEPLFKGHYTLEWWPK